MLDVYRLRLLRELDRRGTLAAVARALSYSPSAISQQLSQLEAETGVTLLEPVGRGVRLTPLARLLVARTEVILERLEEAEAELRAAATEVRGTLRVASFQSVLFALIPTAVSQLAERHPGLRLEITHEQAIPAFDGLLAHEFDLVLGEEYPGVAFPPVIGARTQLLARDELFLVLPSHGPYAVDVSAGRPFRLADLAGVPWVLDPPETAPGAWARNACREAGFEPDVRYAGSDLLFEILLAERGHAASVIPGLLLSAVPRPAARIQRIPGRPHRRLTTGVRAGAAGQPAIRALREALRQAIREASAPAVPDAELAGLPFGQLGQDRAEVVGGERLIFGRGGVVERGQQRALELEVEYALGRLDRLPRQRGDALRAGDGLGQGVGDDMVGEPDRGRAIGRDARPGQRVLLRQEQAGVQRPGERAAVGRDEADLDVRVGQVGGVGHVDDVAERDQAAAEPDRRAVDGRDDRHPAARHAEHEVAAVRDRPRPERGVAAELLQVLEVAAGRERATAPGQHRGAGVVVFAQPGPEPREAGVQRVVDGVERVRPVEGDDPERAVGDDVDLVRQVIHVRGLPTRECARR
jgi:DNA-binding transcriptional LysR family regulator